jgi:hypothetical protein
MGGGGWWEKQNLPLEAIDEKTGHKESFLRHGI